MNCNFVSPLLSAYVDHELTGQQMAKIRSHINQCPNCSKELQGLKKLKSCMLDAPAAPEPSPEFEARLIAAVRESRRPMGNRTLRLAIVLVSAACVFMALGAAAVQRQEKLEKQKSETVRIERSVQSDQIYTSGLDATSGSPTISCSAIGSR